MTVGPQRSYEDTPENRGPYNKGWTYSKRGSSLENADNKGYTASGTWMRGYEDYAAGREKYHQLNCPNHPNCGG